MADESFFKGLNGLKHAVLTSLGMHFSKTNQAIETTSANVKSIDDRLAALTAEVGKVIDTTSASVDRVIGRTDSNMDQVSNKVVGALESVSAGLAEVRDAIRTQGDAESTRPLLSDEQIKELEKPE